MNYNLLFSEATLATPELLQSQKDFSFHREYNWWIYEKNSSKSLRSCPAIVNTSGDIEHEFAKEYAAIVPVLHITNLHETDFIPGDRFKFKDLQFKILEPCMAICLSSIGFAPFCDIEDERYDDECSFYSSTIKEDLDNWFEIFFKGKSIKCEPIPSLDALYRIIMVPYDDSRPFYGPDKIRIPPGKYIVQNAAGKIVSSAGHFGYKSEYTARNAMRHWTNVYPIPQEDIDAYMDFLPF